MEKASTISLPAAVKTLEIRELFWVSGIQPLAASPVKQVPSYW